MNQYDKDKYAEAIKNLDLALKAERFDAAYYYIGLCQWKLDKVEEAIDSFAKAVLLKGDVSADARGHLEKLYKALHNNTTIGIEKVYRRAEAELAASTHCPDFWIRIFTDCTDRTPSGSDERLVYRCAFV